MRIASLRSALIQVAGLVLLLVLAACAVVVEEPGPRPGPGPIICTGDYAPVCAQRGDARRTFSNACQADSANWRIVHAGQCRIAPPPQRFCTREYRPVCAQRGDQRRTFPNACEADRANWRVQHSGECRTSRPPPPPRDEAFCTREYAPVCARRGSSLRTFPNACEARASDFRIVRGGPC